MKRLIIILISALLAFPTGVFAADRIPVYRVDDALLFFNKNTGEITGFAGEPGWLTIPAYISGSRVTSIGQGAFADCQSLRKIVIENGLTTIGERAFYGCRGLLEVQLPASVSSLGASAFGSCGSLGRITFNGPVENIAIDAFDGTPWLLGGSEDFVIAGKTLLLRYNGSSPDVFVPKGVTKIAPYAFAQNPYIERVTLPEGLREIGDNAFVHCYSLESIDFPQSLSFVGLGAFDDTIWLRSCTEDFVIVNGLLIGYNGSESCVSIPEGVTSVGSGVFMSDDRVLAVYLPETVRSVNEGAFGSSHSLAAVIIPDSVYFIDDYAFTGSPYVTLYGSAGSYIENYAERNGLNFSTQITVDVNGHGLYFDAPPVIIDGSAYVPMRAILEKMGLSVYWNSPAQEVTVSSESTLVTATVGSTAVTVNGEERTINAPPIFFCERVMLPVRDFAEIFGFDVSWDDQLRRVIINS
ncbi:MAG: leucine-rich repeat protein [Oscillospiraceae bacterium]|nr:leucine-rich repeat protein [Oscillospiraceae bacterium]